MRSMRVPRLLPAAEHLARFALNRAGIRSTYCEAEGVRVHAYSGRGSGALPPTVLVHGLGAAGSAFTRLAGGVRPHVRRVIVPELPGHGFSAHPGRRVTPDLLLDCMTSALDALVDEPAILYGNSLGGAVALEYAIRRPERVRGLVLVSPAGARLQADEWKELVAAFDVQSARDARRFLDRVYHRPPWVLALVAHEFPDLLRKPAVREILDSATPDGSASPDALAALKMPILLLWGRSEKLLPASALAYFREHLPPHAIIEEPHGFGHSPQLEVPERVGARVVAFAREVVGRAEGERAP